MDSFRRAKQRDFSAPPVQIMKTFSSAAKFTPQEIVNKPLLPDQSRGQSWNGRSLSTQKPDRMLLPQFKNKRVAEQQDDTIHNIEMISDKCSINDRQNSSLIELLKK